MNLDSLREALAQHRDGEAGVHQYDELASAARAVLDSEEVWWCAAHEAAGNEDDWDRHAPHCWAFQLEGDRTACSMVHVRLLPT